jgi:hypothetical protein
MISLDKSELQAIVILKRSPEGKTFIDALNRSANFLSLQNASQRDDVQSRWTQGRVQELLDILNKIKNAEEDLRTINPQEARRHIE